MSTKNIARSFVELGKYNSAKISQRAQTKSNKLLAKKLLDSGREEMIETKIPKIWNRENKYKGNCLKRFIASREGKNFSDLRQILRVKVDSRTETGRIFFRYFNCYDYQPPYEVRYRLPGEVFVDENDIICVHKTKIISKKEHVPSQKELSEFLKNRKILFLNEKYYWGIPNQKSEIEFGFLRICPSISYLIEAEFYNPDSKKLEWKMGPESNLRKSRTITYRQGSKHSESEIAFLNSSSPPNSFTISRI